MRWLPGTLLVSLSLGCGPTDGWPTIHPAGGRVLYSDGEPFTTGGQIEFELIEAGGKFNLPSARAPIQPDGTFRLGTRTQGRISVCETVDTPPSQIIVAIGY